MRVQSCFGVDTVLDCYMYPGGEEEEGGGGGVGRGGVALPKVAGKLVDFAFSSPLLFMLHQSNVVCILTYLCCRVYKMRAYMYICVCMYSTMYVQGIISRS